MNSLQIENLYLRLTRMVDVAASNKIVKIKGVRKGYHFVPTSVRSVVKLIEEIKTNYKSYDTFSDLGCGPDNIGYILTLIGFYSVGVEYNKSLIVNDYTIFGDLLDKRTFNKLKLRLTEKRTIFYSFCPLTYNHKEGKDWYNYYVFFGLLKKIMKEDDIFIFLTIDHSINDIADKYFKQERKIINSLFTVYKKRR